MKSEPEEYSIEDLKRDGRSRWFGVRNYQARNFMRDHMKVGDMVLFYHSSCKVPGVVWLARVSDTVIPDKTQFDPSSKYYDPKSTQEKPIWYAIEVEYKEVFWDVITLDALRTYPELQDMRLLQRGNRLSITPVSRVEYDTIISLSKK